MNISEETRKRIEKNFVQSTYETIAEDFSKTRYKKWPKVDAFLRDQPRGSFCLDVGCGNGKYLDNPSTLNVGCDISSNLLSICRMRNFEVVRCDMMNLPFKADTFDCIICIAALHHLVTDDRRQDCLEAMVDLLKVGGLLYIQVWSFEQHLEPSNKYLSQRKIKSDPADARIVDIDDTTAIAVHENRTPFKDQEMLVPFKSASKMGENLRYYHLFKEGELEAMIDKISKACLVDSSYDQGNWCATIRKDR